VLSPARQAEIEGVVEALARFEPTRIAVERTPGTAAGLERDEVEQLGFRLAARFDHPRLYPVDRRFDFPIGAVLEYAGTHDPEFLDFVEAEKARMEVESNREQRELGVGAILRRRNDPVHLASEHSVYMRFCRVGAGDTDVGAQLVAKWYERNVQIFARLQRIAEPGERVLLIIGSGHAPILRELVRADPALQLVEALDFLPGT